MIYDIDFNKPNYHIRKENHYILIKLYLLFHYYSIIVYYIYNSL